MIRQIGLNLLRYLIAVAGVLAIMVLVEFFFQALLNQSNPIAGWSISLFGKIFTPVGRWTTHAPDWAWISAVIALSLPGAILMTWAVDVAGTQIKSKHKPLWVMIFWGILAGALFVGIYWVRKHSGQ